MATLVSDEVLFALMFVLLVGSALLGLAGIALLVHGVLMSGIVQLVAGAVTFVIAGLLFAISYIWFVGGINSE